VLFLRLYGIMQIVDIFTLYFDGSCSPSNPGGTAAGGFVLSRQGETLASGSEVFGSGPEWSNNAAEFCALAKGLHASELVICGLPNRNALLNVRGDSKLVINIMSKKWRASREKLYYPSFLPADTLVRQLRKNGVTVTFDWVPRELNTECDRLSKAHTVKVS
jgi:ribonuclease HI